MNTNTKSFFIILLFSLIELSLYAQKPLVSGRIFEAENKKTLPGAAVVLKTMGDTIVASAVSNAEGYFELRKFIRGAYKLQVSFLGYQTLVKTVLLAPNKPLYLDSVKISVESQELNDVVVVDNVSSVRVKNDTTEFNASAYKTITNASTEDLIKKMPGIEVDQDGKVKSQGQEVKRVLVDGKPFFGDDPSLALKNLPAEVVERVQVVDQMNEQAQFTGFDDNERIKTMNIVTKKNKRVGIFGKITAGGGTDDLYSVGGNISYFNGDRRISMVGTMNNNNEMNFSIDDLLGVMGGGGFRMGGGGRGGRMGGGGMFMFGGSGLSKTNSIGLNYSDYWGTKIKISASYFMNNIRNNNEQTANRETFISATESQYSNQLSTVSTENYNHRFNMRFEYFIDSMNYLMLRPSFGFQKNNSDNYAFGNTNLIDGSTINKYDLTYWSNTDGFTFNNELQYNHKFNKIGRTFSINANYSTNPKDAENQTDAINLFYTSNSIKTDKTNQRVNSTTKGYAISSNFAYTEPLSQSGILQVNYYIRYNNNNAEKMAYNYNEISKYYDLFVEKYSNTFDNGYKTQRGGLSYMQKIGKSTLITLGTNYQISELINSQVYPEISDMNKSFKDILPYASLTWKNEKKTSLNIYYTTSTRQPDISQLQNVYNIDDPMRITTGNPDLKPEYMHSLSMRFSYVHPASTRTIMFVLSGSYLNNRISNSSTISQSDQNINSYVFLGRGAQLIIPVNISDPYWNLRSFVTLGTPIFNKKINFNINSGISFVNDPGLINNLVNISKTYSFNEGLVLASNISQNLDFTISANITYNKVENSLKTDLNNDYTTQRYNLRANYILLNTITFSSNVTYQTNSGLGQSYNINYTLWNGSVGFQFLKSKNAELKFSVYDILEQNSSVTRNVTQSYIEDVRNLVLKKYYMVSLVYNLRKFGMPQNQNRDENRMKMHDHMH